MSWTDSDIASDRGGKEKTRNWAIEPSASAGLTTSPEDVIDLVSNSDSDCPPEGRVGECEDQQGEDVTPAAGPSVKPYILEQLGGQEEHDEEKAVLIPPSLSRVLKVHQAEGVKFMYDNLVGRVSHLPDNGLEGQGKGCVLAHCMGLGKTLQALTVIYTLLTDPVVQEYATKPSKGEEQSSSNNNDGKGRERRSKLRTALVLVPTNVLRNWEDEFAKWVPTWKKVQVIDSDQEMSKRLDNLRHWQEEGGVAILSHAMFGRMAFKGKEAQKLLLKPGPDVVVVDEAHFFKNSRTRKTMVIEQINTKRRLALTGSPLQNNLKEYYVMVNFVRPRQLGALSYFSQMFLVPITDGMDKDCTKEEAQLMRDRSFVLHDRLKDVVLRKDSTVMAACLPPNDDWLSSGHILSEFINHILSSSLEFSFFVFLSVCLSVCLLTCLMFMEVVKTEIVINVKLTAEQKKLSREVVQRLRSSPRRGQIMRLLSDLTLIWAHPEAYVRRRERDEAMATTQGQEEEEPGIGTACGDGVRGVDAERLNNSMDVDVVSLDEESSEKDEEMGAGPLHKRMKASHARSAGSQDGDQDGGWASGEGKVEGEVEREVLTPPEQQEPVCLRKRKRTSRAAGSLPGSVKISSSGKMTILLEIIAHTISGGGKVLVFSQRTEVLDFVESVLATPGWGGCVKTPPPIPSFRPFDRYGNNDLGSSDSANGIWRPFVKGVDFYRIDGVSTSTERQSMIRRFNDTNTTRLFLLSTGAGSVGINLVSANRVVLLDTSWNPACDLQAMSRCYRLGQTKPVFVYRLVMKSSLEEKIHKKQVTKNALANRVVDAKNPCRAYSRNEKKVEFHEECNRLEQDDDNQSDEDYVLEEDDEQGQSDVELDPEKLSVIEELVGVGSRADNGEREAEEDRGPPDRGAEEAGPGKSQERVDGEKGEGFDDDLFTHLLREFRDDTIVSWVLNRRLLQEDPKEVLNEEEKAKASSDFQKQVEQERAQKEANRALERMHFDEIASTVHQHGLGSEAGVGYSVVGRDTPGTGAGTGTGTGSAFLHTGTHDTKGIAEPSKSPCTVQHLAIQRF
ncbi:unnamed protein product [Discosporangium mesarthrocarpum]